MDLFLQKATERIGVNYALSKIDALMDWASFSPILERGLGRSGVGPQGYDPQVLFNCLLIGQWHGVSDPKLERALKVRLDFMMFCRLDLHAPVPDETTHCRCGLVTLTFRSLNSFMRPFAQMPRGFCRRGMSGDGVDCRSH